MSITIPNVRTLTVSNAVQTVPGGETWLILEVNDAWAGAVYTYTSFFGIDSNNYIVGGINSPGNNGYPNFILKAGDTIDTNNTSGSITIKYWILEQDFNNISTANIPNMRYITGNSTAVATPITLTVPGGQTWIILLPTFNYTATGSTPGTIITTVTHALYTFSYSLATGGAPILTSAGGSFYHKKLILRAGETITASFTAPTLVSFNANLYVGYYILEQDF